MKKYETPELLNVAAMSCERILETSQEAKKEEEGDITIGADDLFTF